MNATRSRLALVVLLAVAADSLVSLAHAQILTQTVFIDTTWRAIGPVGDLTGQGLHNVGLAWEAGHPGWNSQIGFDDSAAAGWTNAIQVMHNNPPMTRYWVDGTDVIGSSPAYFRKLFYIPGVPVDGAMDFNVDDDAQIYVNGQLTFDDANSLDTFFFDANVTAKLHSGWNLWAIKAQDQQGAQSIEGRLDIRYVVPEPGTLGLAAIAALLVARRRR